MENYGEGLERRKNENLIATLVKFEEGVPVFIREAQEKSAQAAAELTLAVPLLEAARLGLDVLRRADLTELKSLKQPSDMILNVCRVLYLMHTNTRKDVEWSELTNMLGKSTIMADLRNFDVQKVDSKVIQRAKLLMRGMDRDRIRQASSAALCFYIWL